MSLTKNSKKFKKEIKSDDDWTDEDYNENNNSIMSLSKIRRNEETPKHTNVQQTTQKLKLEPEDITVTNEQTRFDNKYLGNVEHYVENMLKPKKKEQQVYTRLASTSPPTPLAAQEGAEDFPDENTCSVSLEGRTHLQITSIDGFFNRKRGRPPKNRFVEVYKNKIPVSQCTNDISPLYTADLEVYNCSTNSSPGCNKPKLCGTTENVTVIRAAGTFYPENTNEISKFTDIFLEKLPNRSHKHNRLSSTYSEDELGFPSSHFNVNDMPQDLSIKDINSKAKSSEEYSTTTNSILPQILSVLQMQQQLFAFYQQLALMTPTFAHLDLKSLLKPPILTPASGIETSSVNLNVGDLEQKLSFSNMLLNQHQINQQNVNVNANEQKDLMPETADQWPKPTQRGQNKNSKTKAATTATATATSTMPSTSSTYSPLMQAGQYYSGREHTPTGYLRFRFNEDCGYDKCGYRQHQSHFHCNRADCQYSFCDKTRFVQHTARHERLDTLMGSDFQQYRATTTCNFDNCPYTFTAADIVECQNSSARKSSHFHCLKCQFVCADTNKVVAHRRLHSKMEFIRLAGFRKVANNDNCMNLRPPEAETHQTENNTTEMLLTEESANADNVKKQFISQPTSADINVQQHCPYSMRHAHYHCLICNASVLSRSQLVSHKHRPSTTYASSTETNTETTTSLNSNIS